MSNDASKRFASMLMSTLGSDLDKVMRDPTVIEVMINPDSSIFVERQGQGMSCLPIHLTPDAVMRLIRLIASSCDMSCNESSPSIAAMIPEYNARFQGFIPPVVASPCCCIRKKAVSELRLDAYREQGICSVKQYEILDSAIYERKNILIVGGTGSGKTTLTNALLGELAQTDHRIITIEDTAELHCPAKNTLSFFTRPPIYTTRHAVRDALRVRPDRIIVGEVRDGAALDLLKSWNTGHQGGIATIHANTALQALSRLEQLIAEVSHHSAKQLIADAIDLIVFIERDAKRGRQIREIVQVEGLSADHFDTVTL